MPGRCSITITYLDDSRVGFSPDGTIDDLPDNGLGDDWRGGEIYPLHAADNSPLWLRYQEGINQTGEIYPVGDVLDPFTGAGVSGCPEPTDCLGQVNPVFKRHKTPLSEDMCLLLILRENTLIWRRIPKHH